MIEALMLLAIFCVIVALAAARLPRTGVRSRTICASNLGGIYKALYTYSISAKDRFPVAGASDPEGTAVGFKEGNRTTGLEPVLTNNITASLWMQVRDGSNIPKGFICDSTRDVPDPMATPPRLSFDFAARKHLSYSTINMHHVAGRESWASTARPDMVIMGDNNASDHPKRHRLRDADEATINVIQDRENSPNHSSGEGQNLLFGDGHVTFANDPFQGVKSDNVHAMLQGGRNVPPTLGNNDGDAAADPKVLDSVLIPLSGNGGLSLSGNQMDVQSAPSRRATILLTNWKPLVLIGAIGTALVWGLGMLLHKALGLNSRNRGGR